MSVTATCSCGSRLPAALHYCAVCGAINPGWTPSREERERRAEEELRIGPEGEAFFPGVDPLPKPRPNAVRAAETVLEAYAAPPTRTGPDPRVVLVVLVLVFVAICLVAAQA